MNVNNEYEDDYYETGESNNLTDEDEDEFNDVFSSSEFKNPPFPNKLLAKKNKTLEDWIKEKKLTDHSNEI